MAPGLELFNRSNMMDEKQMPEAKGPKSRSGRKRYGKAAAKMVESSMRRRKKGTLRSGKSGKGGRVSSRKQAIAIGLSQARKKDAKVPKKKRSKSATLASRRKRPPGKSAVRLRSNVKPASAKVWRVAGRRGQRAVGVNPGTRLE